MRFWKILSNCLLGPTDLIVTALANMGWALQEQSNPYGYNPEPVSMWHKHIVTRISAAGAVYGYALMFVAAIVWRSESLLWSIAGLTMVFTFAALVTRRMGTDS